MPFENKNHLSVMVPWPTHVITKLLAGMQNTGMQNNSVCGISAYVCYQYVLPNQAAALWLSE